jgi:AbrB family looped-hinge helix DNA binding protein
METTRLSSKGQVIIPASVRNARRWASGMDFLVIDTADGVLLKPKPPFSATQLADVAGMFKDKVPARSEAQIKAALDASIKQAWRGRS